MLETQKSVLATSERFTLYSLKPISVMSRKHGAGAFHGYPILGQMEIRDVSKLQELVAALYGGIAENTGFEAACHNPRHAIRAVKGRRIVEMTICFECMNIMVFENGRRHKERTTDSPELLFNRVLRSANIAIDKRQDGR